MRGSFARAMEILKKGTDEGNPAVIGPLDMFNLEYHREFFMKLHATARFVLVVGYDDMAKRVQPSARRRHQPFHSLIFLARTSKNCQRN